MPAASSKAAAGKAGPARSARTTSRGPSRSQQVIEILDDSDENTAPPVNKQSSRHIVKQEKIGVKREEGLDDIVAVLGGISLNSAERKVKAERADAPATPAKKLLNGGRKGLIDLSYNSPFPTPAPGAAQAKAANGSSQTPLFLPDDSPSEGDSDWAPAPAKNGKPKRRVIRDPDSDSDDDGPPQPAAVTKRATHTHPEPQSPTSVSSSSPPAPTRVPRAGPSKKAIYGVNRFLDLEARGSGGRSDSESEDEEKEKKWIKKYYDESLGSLRDFIVDDDYVSEVEDSESEESASEEEVPRRRARTVDKGKRAAGKEVKKEKQAPTVAVKKEAPSTSRPIIRTNEVNEIVDSDSSVVHSDAEHTSQESSDIEALLHYSPPPNRLLTLPDLSKLAIHTVDSDSEPERPATPPRPKSARLPVPPTPKTPGGKKQWGIDRARIAQKIFDELDRKVFESKLGPKGAGTKLEWNNRLLTTAGQAHSKRIRKPDGSRTEEVKIILSEKVLTGEEQILSTVAHEMCHVASWLISDERKNPHGKVFKTWGRKVMKARPDIEVTTKHDYQIEYKYQWQCTEAGCDKIYKRHSKSIDIEKQACGRCRGKLAPLFETKKETAFQAYLRQNLSTAKSSMPGSPHGDVMRALSSQWSTAGPEADHKAHWSAMASAARS